MTILDRLAQHARERVARDKEFIGADEIRELASECASLQRKASGSEKRQSFYEAVGKAGMSFICEVKKASPSKGIIDPEFNYMQIAADYEAAGADAISCLTEPKWFLGSDEIFKEIRDTVQVPILRKDFVVDEYQLYQARTMGADCVLLICALLDTETVSRCLSICDDLGMAALVETHDEAEIRSAVSAGARMIGVNNRNLKDFSVDFGNASRLRNLIPNDRLYVAESGVKTAADAAALREAGADAVLIGEAFMRARDKGAFLREMRKAAEGSG